MNNQHIHQSSDYHTLNDIRLRKAQLRTDITKDGNRIAGLWDERVHKPKDRNTPTQRFSGAISTGAGILDGLILGWKLYRKFSGRQPGNILGKRKFSLFRRKKS